MSRARATKVRNGPASLMVTPKVKNGESRMESNTSKAKGDRENVRIQPMQYIAWSSLDRRWNPETSVREGWEKQAEWGLDCAGRCVCARRPTSRAIREHPICGKARIRC